MGSLPAADEQLVRELYATHARPLLGYVRGLTGGDTGRAEDVVQEALLRAWQHPEAFSTDRRGRTSIRAWLFTVARNLVIDGERARRARPLEVRGSTGADGSGPDLVDVAGAVDDVRLDQVLLAWEMAETLDALTPDHRSVIIELYYRDQSVEAAARTLGIPQGTVKSRAYYALRALRAACEEKGMTP